MKRAIPFLILVLLVAAIGAKLLLFDFPRISGNDMAPVVQRGDWLLAYKNGHPARGSLVVIDHPLKNSLLIRRVIGLPGERVTFRKETPVVDGKAASRQVLRTIEVREAADGSPGRSRLELVEERIGEVIYQVLKDPGRRSKNQKTLQLGPGQYYLLADHRNHGTDSRNFGPVGAERIKSVVTHRLVAGDGCVQIDREGFAKLAR